MSILNLQQVAEELFKQIRGTKQMIANKVLLGLHFLFGQKIVSALDILDKNAIKCVIAKPSERRFWVVTGGQSKSPENYLCFKHYCSCYDFNFSVVVKKEELYCKHQLAVIIGDGLTDGITEKEEVSDAEFASRLAEFEFNM